MNMQDELEKKATGKPKDIHIAVLKLEWILLGNGKRGLVKDVEENTKWRLYAGGAIALLIFFIIGELLKLTNLM